MDTNTKELRLAVLIDADNISYTNIKGMMEEIATYGTPTFKRIYGDWTKPILYGWKTVLLENAITPTVTQLAKTLLIPHLSSMRWTSFIPVAWMGSV